MKIHGVCCRTETFWPFNVRVVVVVARLPESISTKLQQWASVRVCLPLSVCVQQNIQSCFVNKIQCCCCCCCCLFMPVFKKSFLLPLLAVVRALPGNYLSCTTTKAARRHRYPHTHTQTHPHTVAQDSSTCAYNYFVYICMATQTESVRNIVMRIRSVCHIHSPESPWLDVTSLTSVICCHVMS